MKSKFTYLTCLTLLFITSCKNLASDGMDPKEFAKEFAEFVNHNGWQQYEEYGTLTDQVDLFVDYSTCVSEAKSSSYYRTVHPVIVDSNPNFYSIKGSQIKLETNNRQQVYQLLNSVTEVNYADIKNTVEMITAGDNHAVLITDGEYFIRGGVLDNLNNPYLAAPFREWLQRGFDIYIYSEPYIEAGRHNKFRYYIFFTDDRVENNICDRFDRSAPTNSNVSKFHLSSKKPQVHLSSNYPQINISLSPNSELSHSGMNYDLQEYYTTWDKIYKYILESAYDDEGNRLENGDYIVKGLYINNFANSSFKITNLKIVTYNIGEAFEEYKMAKLNEEAPISAKYGSGSSIFTIDKELFDQTGEIALFLNRGSEYDGLLSTPNLLKVDIVAEGFNENFTQNNDVNAQFQWQSISGSQSGLFNTSFYESIRQVLLDPSINPAKNAKSDVLYTIYISTYSM